MSPWDWFEEGGPTHHVQALAYDDDEDWDDEEDWDDDGWDEEDWEDDDEWDEEDEEDWDDDLPDRGRGRGYSR